MQNAAHWNNDGQKLDTSLRCSPEMVFLSWKRHKVECRQQHKIEDWQLLLNNHLAAREKALLEHTGTVLERKWKQVVTDHNHRHNWIGGYG